MAKARLSPRSSPKQDRSKKTRTEILEATARLLNKMEEASVTTNHIAKKTGISIGTLYKHYPNKDAILSDLIEAYIEKDFREFQRGLDESAGKKGADVADHLVDWIIKTHKEEHKLRSVLYSNLGRLLKNKRAFEVRGEMAQQLSGSSMMKGLVQSPTQILLVVSALNAMIHTLSQLPHSNRDWDLLRRTGRRILEACAPDGIL